MTPVVCQECGLLMDADAWSQNVTVCKGGFAHISCPPAEWKHQMLKRLQTVFSKSTNLMSNVAFRETLIYEPEE